MKNTKNFASRWGFILASVGSAVGMANVWGFPNKLGSNGGGAFLLIYLLFIFIFSYVGLPAEFAMGRHAATGTLGAYEKAWSTRGKGAGKVGGLLGWLPLAGSLCIAFGYAVIVTYILKALVDSLVGTLMTTDTASWFGTFSSTPYSVIPYHIIVVVGTLLTLYLGAHSIEKTNKIMMPLFFIIFLILAVRVAMLPGVSEGYRFMFTPRWEALKDPMIWIWAMGQAFFSLSVTGSGMIVYGAYLSKEEDVVGVAQHTALFDTIAAVVAARSGMQAPEGEKKLIDLKSDLMGPIAPGDSVVFLVGNFAAQHNGAVITCDSAVRYSDMRIEFFGNVLINKNTTYIYGDRAEYDGELNEARVYSDIVKVVDGDATLYTYKFLFNTKKNIGEFADVRVMLNP